MSRIPIAIVGLNFGHYIVEQLKRGRPSRQFRIVALCDLDRRKAEAELPGLGRGVRVYTDLGEVLQDPEVRAVGLFTGPSGRAALLRRIVRAGKDVITTKPFEVDPAAAAAVLREAAKLGRIIHLNSPAPLLSPDLAMIEKWRTEFDLGRPVGARAEIWADYREKADGGWYDDSARCPLAPIFRLGIYLINDLLRLLGPVESVQAFHSRIRTGRPTPDNAQLALRFRNGALATIYASFCVGDGRPYQNSLALNFERGTVYRNLPGPKAESGNIARLLLVAGGGEGKKPRLRRREGLETSGNYQWDSFKRALDGEALSRLPGAVLPGDIVAGLRVIEAMARAEKSGRSERVKA